MNKIITTLAILFCTTLLFANSFSIHRPDGSVEIWWLTDVGLLKNNELVLEDVKDAGITVSGNVPAVVSTLALTNEGETLLWFDGEWVDFFGDGLKVDSFVKNGTRVVDFNYAPFWSYTPIGWAFGVNPLRLSGWVFILEAGKWAFFAE